jgi:hypothetical protein
MLAYVYFEDEPGAIGGQVAHQRRGAGCGEYCAERNFYGADGSYGSN